MWSPAFGLDQGANIAALGSIRSPFDPRWFGPPFSPSELRAVGQGADEQPVPEVGRADVRSTHTGSPPAVARPLKVTRDPAKPSRIAREASDILDEKRRCAEAEGECEEVGPEVALVVGAALLAGDSPGLAGDSSGEEVDGSNSPKIVS